MTDKEHFSPNDEAVFVDAFTYPDLEPIKLRQLTELGRQKIDQQRELLFSSLDAANLSVPLAQEPEFAGHLTVGDIIIIDKLLALSLIRGRLGGYVCTSRDRFEELKRERVRAVIKNVTPDQKIQLLFEEWPHEFLHFEHVSYQKGQRPTGGLQLIKEPVTIGPEVTVSLDTLRTGQSAESWAGWFVNLVKRNLVGIKTS